MIYPDITIAETESVAQELGKAPFFDNETGQHIITDGRVADCCDAEVIRQWVYKTILTPLGKYQIYTEDKIDYGIEVTKYIGQREYPDGYIASELKREISEQLVKHPYIKGISGYTASKIKRTLCISFTVNLIDGSNIEVEEFGFKEVS
jgi:hypothetical protein